MARSNIALRLGFLTIFYLRFLSVKSDIPLAPALYVFGDSLLDSGNNNLLPTLAKAILNPYGDDFPKGPTGRFTNGRTIADFIAEYLKLPYSPPYVSFRKLGITTGLNYASASCGILPLTGKKNGGCLSLPEQVKLFKLTVEEELPKRYESPEEVSDYLSKSIFVISIGSNDYINNYLKPNLNDSIKRSSSQSFANLLVHNLSQQLQRLYSLGVRKMVVFEIGPIGCIPLVTRGYNHTGKCVEEVNQFVILFNNQLATMINNLSSSLHGSIFVLARVHSLAYNAILDPLNNGFSDTSNPCCKIVPTGPVASCLPLLPACDDVEKHFFWDGYHLTEAAYSLTAQRCIYDSTICTPFDIQKLVQA